MNNKIIAELIGLFMTQSGYMDDTSELIYDMYHDCKKSDDCLEQVLNFWTDVGHLVNKINPYLDEPYVNTFIEDAIDFLVKQGHDKTKCMDIVMKRLMYLHTLN